MMSNIKSTWIAKCRKEWEITIFGVFSATLVVCICLGVLVVSGWWEKDPPLRPPVPKMLDPFEKGAFAFLEERAPPTVNRDHAFRVKVNAEIELQPTPELDEPEKVIEIPRWEDIQPSIPKVRRLQNIRREPEPPSPKTYITYRGYMRTPSGQLRALVRVEDEEAKMNQPMYIPVGSIVKDSRIIKFNAHTLILRTADGKTVTIPIKNRFEL